MPRGLRRGESGLSSGLEDDEDDDVESDDEERGVGFTGDASRGDPLAAALRAGPLPPLALPSGAAAVGVAAGVIAGAAAAGGKAAAPRKAGVRFAAPEDSSDDDMPSAIVPIMDRSGGGGGVGGGGGGSGLAGGPGGVEGGAGGPPPTMATPTLTPAQLKFRPVPERTGVPAAPSSRPDAPDTDDSLRRISVVLVQHIHRAERVALGMGVADSTPPLNRRHQGGGSSGGRGVASRAVRGGGPGGGGGGGDGAGGADEVVGSGLAALMQRFALFLQARTTTSRTPYGGVAAGAASLNAPSSPLEPDLVSSDSDDSDDGAGARGRRGATAAGPAAATTGGRRIEVEEYEEAEVPGAAPPDSVEAMYDGEVEGDDFHEARYLRPQYTLVQSDAGFLPGFGGGITLRRLRYTFPNPTSDDVYVFMKQLFHRAHLTAEACIVSLVYVERLMEVGRTQLRAHNWRPIVLVGLLLASKVWDDLNSWSVEFAAIYPQYTVHAINTMERLFVSRLGFNLFISGSVYARYYFALRALNEQRSFRQRYMNMVGGTAAPIAMVKRIEDSSKGLRDALYSRSV